MGLSIDLGAGNNLPVPPLQPASALGAAPQSKAQSSSEQSIADSIGSVSTGGTQDGVSVSYDAVDRELDFVNTDKGTVAVAAHEALADPHPQYETAPEVNSKIATHSAATDPHGDRAYTDSALSGHVADADPHAQYVKESTTVSAGTGLTGGGDLSTNRTLDLADTAVTPGTYTVATITVDAQGRITNALSGVGGGVTSFNTRTGAITLTSADVTTALGYTPESTAALPAHVADADPHPGYLLKTGGDLSGDLNVNNEVRVWSASGIASSFWFSNAAGTAAADQRWRFGKDSLAESGGDAGSNFFVASYADSGSVTTRLTINRASGLVTVTGDLRVNGVVNAVAGSSSAPSLSFAAQPGMGFYRSGSGLTSWSDGTSEALRLGSTLLFGDVAGGAYTYINRTGGFRRYAPTTTTINIDPMVGDGTSGAFVQLFRNTNTTGASTFQILRGDGSATTDHQIFGVAAGSVGAQISRGGQRTLIGTATDSAAHKVRLGGDTLVDGSVSLNQEGSMLGFVAGAGGSVTQTGSKSAGVTLNRSAGRILTHTASLAAGAKVTFTVTNSSVEEFDVVILTTGPSVSGPSIYTITAGDARAGSFKVCIENTAASAIAEGILINFVVIKGSNA